MEIQCVQWKVARVSVEFQLGTDLITGGVPTSLFPVPSRTRSPSDYPASGWGSDGSPLALERARTSRGLNGKVSRSVLGPMPCQCKCRTGILNCARSSHSLWLLAGRAPDQWISGSVVEGAPTEEPRPDASNARSQRPATRAIGVSRALACVLNTRGCPQAFCTAPVIHPVRVHKYPWQAS